MPARPLKILLLSSAVALGVSAQAQAATITVVKVVDGNTVKVREKAKTRTVDLLGLEVPACHATAARAELSKLLPAKARVKLVKDGAKRGRYVHRGSTFVNAALLRSGAAQGKDAADAQARRRAVRRRERGQDGQARAVDHVRGHDDAADHDDDAPPAAEIERARKDLAGRVFTRSRPRPSARSESRLHLCSDGRFVEDVETSQRLRARRRRTATRAAGRSSRPRTPPTS